MTAATWVVMYLAVGAVMAALMALVVKVGLDRRDDEPDVAEGMRTLESSVEKLPGGMPVALVMIALLWPMLVAIMIRNQVRR